MPSSDPTCPECGSKELVQTGPYRRHCLACNGLFMNQETESKPDNGESS